MRYVIMFFMVLALLFGCTQHSTTPPDIVMYGENTSFQHKDGDTDINQGFDGSATEMHIYRVST